MSSTHGSTPSFRVDIDHLTRLVRVSGELDVATAPLMIDAAACVCGSLPGDVTVDLRAATFIDAGALGALVGLRAQLLAEQSHLTVLGNAAVARVALLCGLSELVATG
jgi:anti-anti-sigma factor